MPPKISNHDANALLLVINDLQAALDEDYEDVPSGLTAALDECRTKLEVVEHASFSKVDSTVLVQVNIMSEPLFPVLEKKALAEERGSAEIKGKVLSMEVLKELIELVRHHVSVVISRMALSFFSAHCTPLPD